MPSRVLIGIPTIETYKPVLERFVQHISALDYPGKDVLFVDNSPTSSYCEHIRNAGHKAGLEIEPVWNQPSDQRKMGRILSNRNVIINRTLSEGYDYLLFLDQDVMAPSDTLSKLVSHGKPICGGVYLSNMQYRDSHAIGPVAVASTATPSFVKRLTVDAVQQPRLLEVAGVGFGCCLLSRTVLEHVPLRVNFEHDSTEDWLTCHDAAQKGFRTFLDTSIWCEHWSKGRILRFNTAGHVEILPLPHHAP